MMRAFRERLMVIVTGSAALGPGGCAERAVPEGSASDGESSEATTDANGSTTPTTEAPTTTTSTSAASSGSAGSTGMRFDIGASPDLGVDPPGECLDEAPGGGFACAPDEGFEAVYKCGALPDSGDCADFDTEALVDATNLCFGTGCWGPWVWNVTCGPDPEVAGACCYFLTYSDGRVCPGRPFLVDGQCRLADTVARDDWGRELALTPVADPQARAALAAAFAEAAAFEHASVASFSRFTLELLAVGAPASLVADSVRATADELEHARLFFALASSHRGAPVGPGQLDVAGALASTDLERAVVRAAAEGCIAETVSAAQASEAARLTRDPAVAARLTALADEEWRHCELAWRFVRWALEHRPSLRPALRAVFAAAATHLPRGPAVPDTVEPALLRAHGMLPAADRLRLAHEALAQVVAPAARALLDPPPRQLEPSPMTVPALVC